MAETLRSYARISVMTADEVKVAELPSARSGKPLPCYQVKVDSVRFCFYDLRAARAQCDRLGIDYVIARGTPDVLEPAKEGRL